MKLKMSIFLVTLSVSTVFGPVQAATIVFSDPISEPPGIQTITSLEPFTFTTNSDGLFARNFVNSTTQTFIDFHFTTTTIQTTPIAGFDTSGPPPAFIDTVGTGTSVDFAAGGAAAGIPPERVFAVVLGNFTAQTTITATPTVPEPSTVMLLGAGLAGLAAKVYRQRRVSKINAGRDMVGTTPNGLPGQRVAFNQ